MSSITMSSRQIVEFTTQDTELLAAFNRVRRFLIKDKKDLRGTIINVRDTHTLNNVFIQNIRLKGVPVKYRGESFSAWMITHKNTYRGVTKGETIFVNTLIGYNISFQYNGKVLAFLELLKKADRFQQHCIINNKPYNEKTWDDYCQMVWLDKESDKLFFKYSAYEY